MPHEARKVYGHELDAMRCIGEMKLTRTEMDVDVKRRRFLARSAAASR